MRLWLLGGIEGKDWVDEVDETELGGLSRGSGKDALDEGMEAGESS